MARERRGIRGRLLRSYRTVIALVLGLLLALYGLFTGLVLLASRGSQTRVTGLLAAEIARSAADATRRNDNAELDAAIGRVLSGGIRPPDEFVLQLAVKSGFSSYNVFLVDRSFRAVYAYREEPLVPDFTSGVRRELAEYAFNGRTDASAYLFAERRSVAAHPVIHDGNRPDEAVFVQSPATGGFLREFAVLLAAGGVFLLVAGVLSGFLAAAAASRFAKSIAAPLRDLADASRRMTEGDLQAPLVCRTGDEIERLSTDMSTMASSLSRTMDRLSAERETVRMLLRVKQDLIANVSHDLRTPIASMKNHLEAMEEKNLVGTEEGRRYMAIVRDETNRLEKLVEDLFLLTRLENAGLPVEIAPVSLQDLVPAVCPAFREQGLRDKQIAVTWEIPPDCPWVLADRQRLEQVLGNLLSNALRYTPEGGIVRVAAFPEGAEVRLEVRDTGIGIDPEDLPHVFDRFFTGEKSRNRSAGGSGLGLSIVKALVERQGGRIRVESVPGEGTSFSVFLKGA
jgi:signal transduction histidine kinase